MFGAVNVGIAEYRSDNVTLGPAICVSYQKVNNNMNILFLISQLQCVRVTNNRADLKDDVSITSSN